MNRKLNMAIVALVLILAATAMVARMTNAPTRESDVEEQATTQDGDDDQTVSLVSHPSTGGTSETVVSDGKDDVAGDSDGATEPRLPDGSMRYEDIPEPSQIEGGYEPDEVKDAIVGYLRSAYPSEAVASMSLIGNGISQSQEGSEPSSYMCYLATTSSGRDIGLFVECSGSRPPHVTEAAYLSVSPVLLYDVENGEYISMETPTGEETVPEETGYPDPHAMPEPGSYKDRMRRLPIPADAQADPGQ